MPRRPRRPDPPPLETNDVPIVLGGTCLWAGALLVLLVLRYAGLAEVRDWWLGMCGYGIALGLFGLYYLRRRSSGAAAHTSRDASPDSSPDRASRS